MTAQTSRTSEHYLDATKDISTTTIPLVTHALQTPRESQSIQGGFVLSCLLLVVSYCIPRVFSLRYLIHFLFPQLGLDAMLCRLAVFLCCVSFEH